MALPDLPPIPEAPEPEYITSEDPYELDHEAHAVELEPGEPVVQPPIAAPGRERASAPDPIDTRLVRRLADILKDTDLSEIEVEKGELKIRVARQAPAAPALIAAPTMIAPPAALVPPAPPTTSEPAPVTTNEALSGEIVKSPMVGAVYLQPSPGAKRFVQAGETVTAGQTLLIIEAMKTMNPVPAPRDGKVTKVMVDDGQPVEFGEPLVVIE